MTKRTIITLVAAVALLGLLLWPGTVSDGDAGLVAAATDGSLTRSRLIGIVGAAFLGLAALQRSEG